MDKRQFASLNTRGKLIDLSGTRLAPVGVSAAREHVAPKQSGTHFRQLGCAYRLNCRLGNNDQEACLNGI